MGHFTSQVLPPSRGASQLQSISLALMFVHTMRCKILCPLRSTSPCRIICPSLNSPTKSRYPPSLSTQVCFQFPDVASNVETLMPRRCIESPPEKFSCTTQPSIMCLMVLVPCPTSSGFSPGHVRSHSPTQKSNCFCCGAEQGARTDSDCADNSVRLKTETQSNTGIRQIDSLETAPRLKR